MNELIRLKGVRKVYGDGEGRVEALRGVDVTVSEGEFIVILGPSGSGKSTLLNIIGGIDSATEGEALFDGKNLVGADEKTLTRYRRHSVGFIFQFYNLMPNLTARENIRLAADIARDPLDVEQVLRDVGLDDRAGHFPSQLSGGQQQRIAIARAVVKNPRLLLCDEPTGALDISTGIQALKVLLHFNQAYGKTVAVITHNASIARMANRTLVMRDGLIVEEIVNENPAGPEEVSW